MDPIALNVDIAPTILELAGVPVPESMQGRSLVPLRTGSTPSDWRDSFIFSYNIDPEFPAAAVVPHLGLRRADGLKLVNYSDDSSWNELYDASRDGDPYEINNLYSLPERADDLAAMKRELLQTTERLGFMKASGFSMKPQGASWSVQGADACAVARCAAGRDAAFAVQRSGAGAGGLRRRMVSGRAAGDRGQSAVHHAAGGGA